MAPTTYKIKPQNKTSLRKRDCVRNNSIFLKPSMILISSNHSERLMIKELGLNTFPMPTGILANYTFPWRLPHSQKHDMLCTDVPLWVKLWEICQSLTFLHLPSTGSRRLMARRSIFRCVSARLKRTPYTYWRADRKRRAAGGSSMLHSSSIHTGILISP